MSPQLSMKNPRWRNLSSRLTVVALTAGLFLPLTLSGAPLGKQTLTPERQQARDRMITKLKTKQAKP